MNPASKVLVDSLVWIKFFKTGDDTLEELIGEDMVCTNELILTELLPVLMKLSKKRNRRGSTGVRKSSTGY